MITKTLTQRAMNVIDQYIHFKFGSAVTNISYFNNKRKRARGALRIDIGKGSPKEIYDEILDITSKKRLDTNRIDDIGLKTLLVDNDIGIDCSGFVYYVLNAESIERGEGPLDKHLHFVQCHGLIGKIRCVLRPVENCGVATFAHEHNSHTVNIVDTQPGDIITMLGISENSSSFDHDHILVIHQIEYQNSIPMTIHYSHAISYPMDGTTGGGVKQGKIDIVDANKSILEGLWTENNMTGNNNPLFIHAQNSSTKIMRLKWF